jgi:biopolymer transport protein ExbD
VLIRDDDAIEDEAMNLTSMTDLVFLLLVFFLCATTFLDPERALDLELPRADSAEQRDEPLQEIVINVDRQGAISINGRAYDRAALDAELERAAANDPRTPVTIRGDKAARHETIVDVMDACGTAGLSNLAVGTLSGS